MFIIGETSQPVTSQPVNASQPVDSGTMMWVIAGVALAAMAAAYFGVRFWLVSTRPPALEDVKTPNVDRLNRSALEHMAEETVEQDEAETEALQDEDSPDDLKAIVPDDPELDKKK